jgi:hypothetical protein
LEIIKEGNQKQSWTELRVGAETSERVVVSLSEVTVLLDVKTRWDSVFYKLYFATAPPLHFVFLHCIKSLTFDREGSERIVPVYSSGKAAEMSSLDSGASSQCFWSRPVKGLLGIYDRYTSKLEPNGQNAVIHLFLRIMY